MLTLGNLTLFLLLLGGLAWLWHGHGIRERALQAVRRHCEKMDVELLDGNVAFRRLAWVRDRNGRRRLARRYGFEFTVTGEQRHQGSILMFGMRAGPIEMAAHPFEARAESGGQVIQLDEWRRSRD
ncbi:DUF3301 domain-containing protein [Stutzerimonas nosocomialis]|uniref:DUF3301 domain-containing protein n=1 Tax=Stutzerimonas nosocomialis TaxID=1056496 RepID=A0A5R9QA75_9GAMM|nr:DUF3301 domain-containing protein [Stutzerimonas nosocomialis]TLX53427.1 DUF3301 domain-containing protein [Stutzerimonas nosocomialis]TLX56450.1 DUF3301 domain-containing protein [Stutzerimonas nosocomialis]TLX61788.1 DUF3301 domain-containing protein [Stutzerimonas nosocomialis]